MTMRTRRAAYLRRCGLTFREIGVRMGVTAGRAHQMVQAAPMQERRQRIEQAYMAESELDWLFYEFSDSLIARFDAQEELKTI